MKKDQMGRKYWLMLLLFVCCPTVLFAQNKYEKYLDSADRYLSKNPNRSISFLNKIPEPKSETFKGKMAEFYETLAFAHYHKDNFGLAFRNMMLSAKYAEKESKYRMAGGLYVEMFTLHRQIEEKPNLELLKKASENFQKIKDEDGLLEVLQAQIYNHYIEHDYVKCVNLSLKNLQKFRKQSNPLTDLVANYLIASAYFRMDELVNGMQFYAEVKRFNDTSIVGYSDYIFHETALNYDVSNFYYRKKEVDSSLYYFHKVTATLSSLDYTMERDYYELGSKIYSLANRPYLAAQYLDSLVAFEQEKHESSLKESLKANEKLVMINENLEELSSKNKFYRLNLVVLAILSLGLIVVLIYYRLKIKAAALALKAKIEDTFSLKKNQHKMSTQINQLEGYIAEIKTEVKNISQEETINLQRDKLQKLYTEINLKINESSDKDHLHVVNDMNEGFFEKLSLTHPSLSESEKLICYYLALGFKNKEVAGFLNTSVRSVEGRRFRLRQKLNNEESTANLVTYLATYLEPTI